MHHRFPVLIVCVAIAAPASAQCSSSTGTLITQLKYDEARAEAQALLKKNASDDAAMECMGSVFMAEGKSGSAVDWYEKAIKVNDTDARHHLLLGQALGTEAQHANTLRQPFLAKRVKSEFERTVALDPSLIDGHDGLLQFYLQAPGFMGGSLDKAKEQATAIGRLNALQGHYAMTMIAVHEQDFPRAERELQTAIAEAPDSLAAQYSLGSLYQNERKWSNAFDLYDRMITERPSEVMPHFWYGRAAAVSGENTDRGERELKYWLANSPKNAPVVTQSGAHMRLGMIYERQGKKDIARSEYQTALSINPKNTEAKKMLDALK
jgi:Tfp pilus assembly protein PilF